MRLVKPSVEFLWMTPDPLAAIEAAGRTCYKSEDRITTGSAEIFAGMLIKRGHEAMLEHASASYRVICDRGVSHEIVRHRLFSYAQESTRYCNYKGGVSFVIPPWVALRECEFGYEDLQDARLDVPGETWTRAMLHSEEVYKRLIGSLGWQPQQARAVLPNSLKTEIVITGNFREWRHFFKLRTAPTAHPQMREVAGMILSDIRDRVPVVFWEQEANSEQRAD